MNHLISPKTGETMVSVLVSISVDTPITNTMTLSAQKSPGETDQKRDTEHTKHEGILSLIYNISCKSTTCQ